MSKKTLDQLNILPHSLSAISNLDVSSASFTGIFEQKKTKQDPSQYKIKVKRPYQFGIKNPNQQVQAQKNHEQQHENDEFDVSQDEQQYEPKIQAQQIPLKQNITGYQICKHSLSEQQIIEAFKVIDINKDNLITQEDIVFFLQYIKQPYTKEEVRQMIEMVSGDKRKVTFDDFKNIGKGTIIPFADIKIPDQNVKQKKKIYQKIKNSSSLYNQNPSILINASKNEIISEKKFQESKKVSKINQFESIKLIDEDEKLNFIIQKIKLLSEEELLQRKQQFNLVQMVNITQIINNYNQLCGKDQNKSFQKYIGYKEISKLLQITQKQAKILYGDKNKVLSKKVVLEAIVYSKLNKIKKLQLGMMIMLNKKTINFNQLYFLMQLLKGKDQSQSLKKKLLTVFKSKNISQQEDIDKLYALQLIGNYSFNFNF